MIVDLAGTTVAEVSRRLLELREDVGAMALSRVLTLIVVTDDRHAEAALQVASDATHQHPSRIVCAVSSTHRGSSRIDGQIRVGGDAGASEIVVLRLFGELVDHADSVVLPLLLADSPIVAWWPYDAPKDVSADPVGRLAQRRITDAEHSSSPPKALRLRAKTYRDGDTDLVWTRTTKWRGLLAAALDQPPFEPVTSATVTGGRDSASTDLLAGWLATSLGCRIYRARTQVGTGLISVRLTRSSGDIDLVRPDGILATLTQPGQPTRRLALARRHDAECLSDELARLDADEVYAAALLDGLGRIPARNSVPSREAIDRGIAPEVKNTRSDDATGTSTARTASPGPHD